MVTHLPDQPGVFQAIADPTRRAILDGLSGRERTAGEIAGDFSISRPAVSKHLRVLTEAGLVRVERRGRERRFTLEPTPLADVDAWLTRYRTMWSRRLVDLKAHAEQLATESTDPDAGDVRDEGSTR